MKRKFKSELESLKAIKSFLEECVQNLNFKPLSFKVELAVEEAVTNIILYSGSPDLELIIEKMEDDFLQILIKDHGQPYNPLEQFSKKSSTSYKQQTDSTPLGGYGIPLICSLMDSVDYKRENNFNHLTIIKKEEKQKE